MVLVRPYRIEMAVRLSSNPPGRLARILLWRKLDDVKEGRGAEEQGDKLPRNTSLLPFIAPGGRHGQHLMYGLCTPDPSVELQRKSPDPDYYLAESSEPTPHLQYATKITYFLSCSLFFGGSGNPSEHGGFVERSVRSLVDFGGKSST